MKLTKENEKILLKLGFKPDEKKEWWTLDCGWTFEIDSISNFKQLIHRIIVTTEENTSTEHYWES